MFEKHTKRNFTLIDDGSAGINSGSLENGDSGAPDVDLSALVNADQGQVQTQQQADKTFTQVDVDRIIGERLAREREKYQGYDDVQAQLGALQGHGYTLPDVLAYLEQQANEQQQQVMAQQADELGVPTEVVQKLNEYDQRFAHLDSVEANRVLDADINRLGQDAQFGQFFRENKMEILQTALNHGIADLETAMGRVFLQKYPEIRQQQTQSTQQQTIRQIQQRGTTQVDNSTQSGAPGADAQLSPEQMAIAQKLGISTLDYAKNIKKR